jgi:hypothetical protein
LGLFRDIVATVVGSFRSTLYRAVTARTELFLGWQAEKDDRRGLKKSILRSEKSRPLPRRAGESAENRKKQSWYSKINVNFTYFGIIVRASQPRRHPVRTVRKSAPDRHLTILDLSANLCVHSKSSRKVPRPNSSPNRSDRPTFSKASYPITGKCGHLTPEIFCAIGTIPDGSAHNFPRTSISETFFFLPNCRFHPLSISPFRTNHLFSFPSLSLSLIVIIFTKTCCPFSRCHSPTHHHQSPPHF